MPLVPTTVSSTMAAIVWPPSTMITSARWARARAHSSASSVAWNAERYVYGPQNLTMPGDAGLAAPAAGVAGHRDRRVRRAVVAAVRRQHLEPAGVAAGHADGVLGRLGAAVGEEHHVEVAGGQLGDQAGRLAAGVVGVERGDRAELVGLLLDGGDQLGVLVADVDVDQLAGEVEVAVALVVPEARPLGADDDERVERGLRRPRVEHVGPVVDVGLRAGGVDRGHAARGYSTPGVVNRTLNVTAQSQSASLVGA